MPVVPVAIRGTRSVLQADTWMPRRGQITITIGRQITADAGVEARPDDDWATAVKLREAAHQHILAHCGEVDLSYRSSRT